MIEFSDPVFFVFRLIPMSTFLPAGRTNKLWNPRGTCQLCYPIKCLQKSYSELAI